MLMLAIIENTSFFSVQLNALHVRFCTINFDSKLALGVWAPPVTHARIISMQKS